MDNGRTIGEDYCYRRFAFFGVTVILFPWDAMAATTSQTTGQGIFFAGVYITWAIVYYSRRRAIGGWLLYFYLQLYLSFLLFLLFLPLTFENLLLSEWDSSKLYVLNLISVVPVLLLTAAETYVATMLLARRSEANVKLLRKVLLALTVASAIALGIDLTFFEDGPNAFFDGIMLVFVIIWLAYFYNAKRVRLVFIENRWEYVSSPTKRVLTPEDRRQLRHRTLIASTVTFVALLILMGLALGDKKPDAGIFFVPLFCAIIAALIVWYLPLPKRKGERQSDVEPTTSSTP